MIRKAVAPVVILVVLVSGCVTTGSFSDQLKRDLIEINNVYLAAVAWYNANSDTFTPEQRANVEKLKATYVASFDALQKAVAAYDSSLERNYSEMIASIAAIVFDVLTIVRTYGKSSKTKVLSTYQLPAKDKKELILQMARSMKEAHARATSENCANCHTGN